MTRDELAAAQYLHGIWERASGHSVAINPVRTDAPETFGTNQSIDRKIVALGRLAADAFHELTGKLPIDVPFFELNTRRPAEWTKTARENGKLKGGT